jgi:glycosyltransferase involved in cell wall biosynthesis
MSKTIHVAVSNDLRTDQRVRKECSSLHCAGFSVKVIGCNKNGIVPEELPYQLTLLPVFFKRGFLFYAEWNLRLFIKLIFSKSDLFWSNDLDTLPACGLASFFKNKHLVYDSHELFTEVPEIQNKRLVKGIWKFFERIFIRNCDVVITVNDSIAQQLSEMYSLQHVEVLPNVPVLSEPVEPLSRSELSLPEDVNLMIYQGSGINVDRGTEELIEAMPAIKNAVLLVVGGGDVIDLLKEKVQELKLQSRVLFIPRMPYEALMRYTALADLGLSLDKPSNLNYRYSLPNKVFDYASQGTPVFSSDLPELSKLVKTHKIGYVCKEVSPEEIAKAVNSISFNSEEHREYGENGLRMTRSINWQKKFEPILSKVSDLIEN